MFSHTKSYSSQRRKARQAMTPSKTPRKAASSSGAQSSVVNENDGSSANAYQTPQRQSNKGGNTMSRKKMLEEWQAARGRTPMSSQQPSTQHRKDYLIKQFRVATQQMKDGEIDEARAGMDEMLDHPVYGSIPRMASYWCRRAELEASYGDFESVLAVYQRGLEAGAKPLSDLEGSMRSFLTQFNAELSLLPEEQQKRLMEGGRLTLVRNLIDAMNDGAAGMHEAERTPHPQRYRRTIMTPRRTPGLGKAERIATPASRRKTASKTRGTREMQRLLKEAGVGKLKFGEENEAEDGSVVVMSQVRPSAKMLKEMELEGGKSQSKVVTTVRRSARNLNEKQMEMALDVNDQLDDASFCFSPNAALKGSTLATPKNRKSAAKGMTPAKWSARGPVYDLGTRTPEESEMVEEQVEEEEAKPTKLTFEFCVEAIAGAQEDIADAQAAIEEDATVVEEKQEEGSSRKRSLEALDVQDEAEAVIEENDAGELVIEEPARLESTPKRARHSTSRRKRSSKRAGSSSSSSSTSRKQKKEEEVNPVRFSKRLAGKKKKGGR